jgi:hypothetical protein
MEDTVVVTAVVWSVWFGVQAHKGTISIAAVNRVDFTGRSYPFVVCTDTLSESFVCVLLIRNGERSARRGRSLDISGE